MGEKNIYSEIIDKYLSNYKLKDTLDEELHEFKSLEEWGDVFRKRAEKLRELFEDNQHLLDALQELLSAPLTDATAELIYQQVCRLYNDSFYDVSLCLPMIYKLIPYYEEREAMQQLIFLYHAAYISEAEIRARSEGHNHVSLEYLQKIVAYRGRYTEFEAVEKSFFWSAYHNLSVSALSDRIIDIETSYKNWKEAMEFFWYTPEVQEEYIQSGKQLAPLEGYLDRWIVIAMDYIDEASQEAKDAFCRYTRRIYEEKMNEVSDVFEIDSEIYGAYLHMQILLGEKSLEEVVDEYFNYYQKKIDSDFDVNNLSQEDFYFIINAPLITEFWLKKGIEAKKSKMIMRTFHENLQRFWNLKNHSTPFLNEFYALWCTKIIGYLDTLEEKENCICQLLLRRQLPTYLHSVMVMKLSEFLCKEAIRVKPSLFADIKDISLQDMEAFVRKCGLLHDLGKTKITDIINTQSRKITDREFGAIMNHPDFGAEILRMDPDLVKYSDVVIGHHKSYDGSTGYPAGFDNTECRNKIVVDIVTICDCIDAATDYLGRNYKNAKTLDEVLRELIEGKGMRYNPHLVELIENSENVKKEMRKLVEAERLELMYQAYVDGLEC